MPSTRACAAFEPISPDFDVKLLVESTPSFEWVVRIHCDMIDHQGIEAFEKLVLIHVILGGKPLVVEGYDSRLDRWTFAVQWLRDNMGSKVENPRDLTKKATVPMTFAHYLNHMDLLTNQWTSTNYKDPERQRIYLKDIDCPPLWHEKLHDVLPSFLYYLNDTTGEFGGFGAVDEPDPGSSGLRRGRGVGKAGDLMSCLPKEMQAENMMCYIGHEGTYTPSHREMCASLGQNIMVEASTGLVEDGKPTKPGSSIWFMTESKERAVVAEYWLSKLGHDIEVENHFAQINAWRNAPFTTYVVEQKPGDFILIPPLAPHQVWNRGTRTMKVAWNRTTVETLEMALHEALPQARTVCRDEQYKNKAIIYFALQKYSKLLKAAEKFKQRKSGSKQKSQHDIKVRQLEKDFRRLHGLYTQVLLSESWSPLQSEKPELVPFEGFITCSYCRCNIFNRFLTCPSCVADLGQSEQDTYDVCMDCYATGRSCACISKLRWVEQFPWTELSQKHDQWRQQILAYDGKVTEKSPMSLKVELQRLGDKRTLAQICQLELKKRPWRDITKPPPKAESVNHEEEVELDMNGNVKKTKKKVKRSEKFMREHAPCHVDKYWEPKWKQATCSSCDYSFCYGSLFRGYDERPEDIMANPNWKCPSCRKICGCRHCRNKPGYEPFTPSRTYLGHNTKAVADPRSVESLVDYSCSNISWIQKAGDDGDDTRRLKKRRHEADAAQAQDPQLGEDYVDEHDRDVEGNVLRLAQHEGIPIDPSLDAMGATHGIDTADEDEDIYEENPEGRTQDNGTTGTGPLAPQYVVPEGGIIRDSEHAYEFTEAITYDYPDPDMGVPVAIPMDSSGQAPSGYGPTDPGSPGDKIAMVSRKRKRNKLDEGDKAFIHTKRVALDTPKALEKPKPRQSLVLKFSITKEKLAEVNKIAIIAQRALDGVGDAPAPVVGSDLQALNVGPIAEGQLKSKKARLDQPVIELDDEFTPGRYRDRRKGRLSGLVLPHPDADVTRRTTRMQAVTYEEPDEDDFMETPGDGTAAHSKLAAMEQAINVDSESGEEQIGGEDGEKVDSPASNGMEVHAQDSTLLPSRPATSILPSPPKSASSVPQPNGPVKSKSPPLLRKPVAPLQPKTQSTPQSRAAQEARPSTASSTNFGKDQYKALAEARANRAAKMAAMAWMEHDSGSLDDGYSEEESEASPPKKQQQQREKEKSASVTSDGSVSVPKEIASASASASLAPAIAPPKTVAHALVTSNLDPASAASATMRSRQGLPASTPQTVQQAQPIRSVSVQQPQKVVVKATEADWSDSDSDDGPSHVKSVSVASKGGWTGVNGRGSGNGGGNHASGVNPVAKRGRGRPRIYR